MTMRTVHLLALFLATTVFSAVALAGPKPGDIYSSPLKNFRVTVPDYPLGTKVKKSNDKFHGFVSFTGGAGDVSRIGYQRLDPLPPLTDPDSVAALSRAALVGLDSLSRAALLKSVAGLDSVSRESLLRTIFRQLPDLNLGVPGQPSQVPDSVIMGIAAPAVQQVFNMQQQLLARYNARVMSWEPLVLDSTLMVLVVAVAPEGSTNVNLATGKNLDAVFGHLVFIKGEFIYNLLAQPNAFATSPQAELAQDARRLVKKLYATIVFQ
jgi:hypothetical protein